MALPSRNFPTNVLRQIVKTRTFYVDVDFQDGSDNVLIGVYGMHELNKLLAWSSRSNPLKPARLYADIGSAEAALNGRHQMDAYTNMTQFTPDDIRTLRDIFIEEWGPVDKVEHALVRDRLP